MYKVGDRVIIKAIRKHGGDPNEKVFGSISSENDTGREGVIISEELSWFDDNCPVFIVRGETNQWDIHESDLELILQVIPVFKREIRKLSI